MIERLADGIDCTRDGLLNKTKFFFTNASNFSFDDISRAISDKLRYCTVETDNTVFIQGVGYVEATADKIFTADSGQVYLGGKKFLGAYAYPEGLKVKDFSVEYNGTERVFTVKFQIKDRRDTKLAEADFQVKQINQETN